MMAFKSHDLLASKVGLILSCIPAAMHSFVAIEWLFPVTALNVVNWVLPLFGLSILSGEQMMSYDDATTFLNAGMAALPEIKQGAAEDYAWIGLFLQRQASAAHLVTAITAIYALQLPLADRHVLHVANMALSAMMTFINLNHAGVPFFGYNPIISFHGMVVGIVFTPFWLLCVYLHFVSAKATKKK